MNTYEGSLEGGDLSIALVASRFNEALVERLLEGAVQALDRNGVGNENISVTWVPGAFELPIAAKRLAASGEVDAVICIGAIVRGETPHFDFVAGAAATGITEAALSTGVPITFGVLTTDDADQALDRAGGKMGNKGEEAALAALEMANLFGALPKPTGEI